MFCPIAACRWPEVFADEINIEIRRLGIEQKAFHNLGGPCLIR